MLILAYALTIYHHSDKLQNDEKIEASPEYDILITFALAVNWLLVTLGHRDEKNLEKQTHDLQNLQHDLLKATSNDVEMQPILPLIRFGLTTSVSREVTESYVGYLNKKLQQRFDREVKNCINETSQCKVAISNVIDDLSLKAVKNQIDNNFIANFRSKATQKLDTFTKELTRYLSPLDNFDINFRVLNELSDDVISSLEPAINDDDDDNDDSLPLLDPLVKTRLSNTLDGLINAAQRIVKYRENAKLIFRKLSDPSAEITLDQLKICSDSFLSNGRSLNEEERIRIDIEHSSEKGL